MSDFNLDSMSLAELKQLHKDIAKSIGTKLKPVPRWKHWQKNLAFPLLR
jgi:hypothetical protein